MHTDSISANQRTSLELVDRVVLAKHGADDRNTSHALKPRPRAAHLGLPLTANLITTVSSGLKGTGWLEFGEILRRSETVSLITCGI